MQLKDLQIGAAFIFVGDGENNYRGLRLQSIERDFCKISGEHYKRGAWQTITDYTVQHTAEVMIIPEDCIITGYADVKPEYDEQSEYHQIIHFWKVAVSCGDKDKEKEYRKWLDNYRKNRKKLGNNVVGELNVIEKEFVVMSALETKLDKPKQKIITEVIIPPSPKNISLSDVKWPDGEWLIKDLMSLNNIRQPLAQLLTNFALNQGIIKYIRSQSYGRGRPSKVYEKN